MHDPLNESSRIYRLLSPFGPIERMTAAAHRLASVTHFRAVNSPTPAPPTSPGSIFPLIPNATIGAAMAEPSDHIYTVTVTYVHPESAIHARNALHGTEVGGNYVSASIIDGPLAHQYPDTPNMRADGGWTYRARANVDENTNRNSPSYLASPSTSAPHPIQYGSRLVNGFELVDASNDSDDEISPIGSIEGGVETEPEMIGTHLQPQHLGSTEYGYGRFEDLHATTATHLPAAPPPEAPLSSPIIRSRMHTNEDSTLIVHDPFSRMHNGIVLSSRSRTSTAGSQRQEIASGPSSEDFTQDPLAQNVQNVGSSSPARLRSNSLA
ncbi:hypothetical protein FRB95_006309 [Tulasnella sp. JGI-2019a]|nr:hypothetical protein FRB95_006309 [Tulasnella sp. JGI-2019a]